MRPTQITNDKKFSRAVYAPPINHNVWQEAMRLTQEAERRRQQAQPNNQPAYAR